ncbi:polysaccharide deacetylase family protein [Siminovitchia sp. FSL W7-1587]|uniref:polysaccharide deacetylase family protein n=1 Tax=Siminovitchia sp. FSL W7-1587 TaxID=2954699 RepID=UPI0030D21C8E
MKRFLLLSFLFLLCASTGPFNKPVQSHVHQVKAQPVSAPDQPVVWPSSKSFKNKYQNTFLMRGPGTKREVALTFDDAPDDIFTPTILDILKEKDAKATFFLVGFRIEKYPEVVKRIVQEGHAIGNHSYNHPNFLKLTDADFRNQIIRTDQLIIPFTGFAPTLIRPPYGNISERQIEWLAAKNKIVVNWDVDSLDWKGINAEQVAGNILPNVSPGSIVLQHSGTGEGGDLSGTVHALPNIIDELRKKGYKLVTVQEMLNMNHKQ